MKSLVILISGRGSNMQAIVETARREAWQVRLAGVVAHRGDSAGLAWAAAQGLPTALVDHRDHPERAAFDAHLAEAIRRLAGPDGPDLLALAGFMRVLGSDFVQAHAGRMVNIHPSLLPAFPGLHTHRRALQAGCRFAGATVHGVTAELDHGPIAAQACVPVLPDDDESALAARVLEREHRMYPRVIDWLLRERLVLRDGRYRQLDGESTAF